MLITTVRPYALITGLALLSGPYDRGLCPPLPNKHYE